MRRIFRRGWFAVIAASLVMATSACGAVTERATEELIERAAESAGEGNVELDLDGDAGSFSVQSEDGSFQVGSDLELPDGLTLPVPSGGNVTSTATGDGFVSAGLIYPQDRYDELTSFYQDWVADQPGEFQTSTNQYTSDGTTFRSASWYGLESGVAITVSDCFDMSGEGMGACVNLNNE